MPSEAARVAADDPSCDASLGPSRPTVAPGILSCCDDLEASDPVGDRRELVDGGRPVDAIAQSARGTKQAGRSVDLAYLVTPASGPGRVMRPPHRGFDCPH